MSSYQNGEANMDLEGNVLPSERKVSGSSLLWRSLTVVAVLGATAMFAYTANDGYTAFTSKTRIQLAKTGRSDVKFTDLSEEEVQTLFSDFKSHFGKRYETNDEESERLSNFRKFLAAAQKRNDAESANGGTAIHGVTKFADRSEEEFKALLGYKRSPNVDQPKGKIVTIDDYDPEAIAKASSVVDWTGTLTTAMKDQGYCGSCWAFSATSQLESDAIRAGYLTTDDYLSEQQIVSCDRTDYGCDGGYTEYAYTYVYNAGGLVSETSYPYTSYWDVTGACKMSSSMTKLVTVTDGTYYTLDDEKTMAAHVMTTGPLSVCLDASDWSSYVSGIVSTCGDEVDHCVQVVGLNSDDGYWIVRNSWGTTWGVDGFIYLSYGSDTCSITTDPTYVDVSEISSS